MLPCNDTARIAYRQRLARMSLAELEIEARLIVGLYRLDRSEGRRGFYFDAFAECQNRGEATESGDGKLWSRAFQREVAK